MSGSAGHSKFVEKPYCKEFHRLHCGRREAAALNTRIAAEQNQIPSFLWAQGESPQRGKERGFWGMYCGNHTFHARRADFS